jgi:hypothetical protein
MNTYIKRFIYPDPLDADPILVHHVVEPPNGFFKSIESSNNSQNGL